MSTSYNFAQLEELWIQNGGSPSTAPIMAAIAIAESGGCANCPPSSTGDYGLFQINRSNFPSPNWNWSDPNTNTQKAIQMSDNGQNVAAWCTAWTNPKANCGHGSLSSPQAGSPAYKALVSAGGSSTLPAVKQAVANQSGTAAPGACSNAVYLINTGTGIHLIDQCQASAFLGGALMLVGAIGMLVSVAIVLKAIGASGTAAKATRAVPFTDAIVGAAAGKHEARKVATTGRKQDVGQTKAYTEGKREGEHASRERLYQSEREEGFTGDRRTRGTRTRANTVPVPKRKSQH